MGVINIGLVQAYAYFFGTALLVFLLYAYMYHLYTFKKRGGRDYEKYSDIMLYDNISDAPVKKINSAKS